MSLVAGRAEGRQGAAQRDTSRIRTRPSAVGCAEVLSEDLGDGQDYGGIPGRPRWSRRWPGTRRRVAYCVLYDRQALLVNGTRNVIV
jgi:hypothetical protein